MRDSARAEALRVFVDSTEWCGSVIAPLAGDASNRRYFRVRDARDRPAVLMDAPPEKGEDTRPFIKIAKHLKSAGLSAPYILAADVERGFLLIEDLGDALYSPALQKAAEMETELYAAAVDVLVALGSASPLEGIGPYDARTMGPLAGLAATWYAGDRSAAEALAAMCTRALDALSPARPVLALRDYHAENLIWLPERKGVARVGLLDFQDARMGHPAYDLASLLRDARRDVSQHVIETAKARFAEKTETNLAELDHALAAQGAQRNLRILGVFARLSLHFGKPHYIDLIPRVWSNLMTELSHPALEELRSLTRELLPDPTETHLDDLKRRCGTIPTLA